MSEELMPRDVVVGGDDSYDIVGTNVGNNPFLPENLQKVNQALQKCEKSLKVWNRSHSNFTWNTITIGGEHTPLRRLRQISAEISRKKDAMTEAQWKYIERLKQAEMKERDSELEEDELKKEYLKIQAKKLRSQAAMIYKPFAGAAKDVMELSRIYDKIVADITEKHGKFDEEVFEIEEARYWVIRSVKQSLRDVRERGRITKGEQELLEQIGLDPSVMEKMFHDFLATYMIDGEQDVSSAKLDKFAEDVADKFYGLSVAKLERIGFDPSINSDALYLDGPSGDTNETEDSSD